MNEITVSQLNNLDAPTLFDVREPEEYSAGHVPGARNLPLSGLEAHVAEVPRDTPVHVICQSGVRSARAADFLKGQGIDVTDVAGGTSAWIEAGYPTVQE